MPALFARALRYPRAISASRAVPAAVVISLMAGCSSWVKIHQKSPGAELASSLDRSPGNAAIAVVASCTETINGRPSPLDRANVERVIKALRNSNLFSRVVSTEGEGTTARRFKITVKSDSLEDLFTVSNGMKAFFTGFTLFLLTPALPLKYDWESRLTLKASRVNGETRQYEGTSSGTARWYAVFSGPAWIATTELRGKVASNNLNAVIAGMVRDANFFLAPE